MNTDFAFSGTMQSILAGIAFLLNTASMYLAANLILRMYDQSAGKKQKLLFALLTGAGMQTLFIYTVYFIGGALSFSPLVYLLIVSPNPLFSLLYLFFGIKVLKLSAIRSVKLMILAYLYIFLLMDIHRLVASVFFIQNNPAGYNYMLDAVMQIANFAITVCAYWTVMRTITRKKISIRLEENLIMSQKREIMIYMLFSVVIYILSIIIPLNIANQVAANTLTVAIIGLIMALKMSLDKGLAKSQVIDNRDAYISTLSSAISEFSGIKHDFYNILETYGGYIELGDMDKLKTYHTFLLKKTIHAGRSVDIGKRMSENPPLVSLLMSKLERAEGQNIQFQVSIKSDIDDLFIDSMELCRALACLLDNAIEAAAESEAKKILFTIEKKPGGTKLIIITNSTSNHVDTVAIMREGVTSKPGHTGIGMTSVRKIIDKYENCSFHLTYYNYELNTYLELKAH